MGIAELIPSRQPKPTSRAGFTLAELVIVVLIIGILAAVTAPKFADTLHGTRAEAAAKRIKVDLGYVRQAAISQSSALTVSFTSVSDGYSIPGLPDLNHPSKPYAVALNSPPYNAVLISVALGGDENVQFDRFGRPDSGGVITVESGGYQKTVTIDPETGKAFIP